MTIIAEFRDPLVETKRIHRETQYVLAVQHGNQVFRALVAQGMPERYARDAAECACDAFHRPDAERLSPLRADLAARLGLLHAADWNVGKRT